MNKIKEKMTDRRNNTRINPWSEIISMEWI